MNLKAYNQIYVEQDTLLSSLPLIYNSYTAER